jgi:hypothetical protein
VGKPEGKTHLGKPRCRLKDVTGMGLGINKRVGSGLDSTDKWQVAVKKK